MHRQIKRLIALTTFLYFTTTIIAGTKFHLLMKYFKKILIIVCLAIVGDAHAQIKVYKEIRISRVHKYHSDSYFNRTLKFNAIDSSVWFRKKEKRKFKKIDKKASQLFFDVQTYIALDSLLENFANYKKTEPRKKTELYRIELFISSSKSGLEVAKTIYFPYNPGAQGDLLENLIYEYRKVLIK